MAKKPFSYWSDKAIDAKAEKDARKGKFDQPPGWLGKTLPGNYDYDRYSRAYKHHRDHQASKKK